MRRRRLTAEQRRAEDERREWAASQCFCWACGSRGSDLYPLHTHEVVRRSETAQWRHMANYVRICERCHSEAHGGYLTKGVLLTLKLLFNGDAYDPEWIRKHAIAHHWEPEPLPTSCRWFIHT